MKLVLIDFVGEKVLLDSPVKFWIMGSMPRVGEDVLVKGNEYKVFSIMHDYDSEQIKVYLSRKIS